MSYRITQIEGIGPRYRRQLRDAGVRTISALLKRASRQGGRRELATASGIDETLILKWANMADLMRINGVGEEYSELLQAAGVDNMNELSNQTPKKLAGALTSANTRHRLVGKVPSERQVGNWIQQAQNLDPTAPH